MEDAEGAPKNGRDIAASRVNVKEIRISERTSPPTLGSSLNTDKPRQWTTVSPPRPNIFDKVKEVGRLGLTRTRVFWQDIQPEQAKPHVLLSTNAKYSHRYVEPLGFWWGKNTRLLLGQALPSSQIQGPNGSAEVVVNSTSHNYAGFYKADPRSEELQRSCLERLPLSDAKAVPLLETGAHNALTDFLGADFCYTTSTGYCSNYVVFTAFATDCTTVILADKTSHSSMFAGMYLAQSGRLRLLRFGHNDANDLERLLKEINGKYDQIIVAVEGLYSMEADVPPLHDLHRLKEKYNFTLFCDEAHSLLSLGATGRGCLEYWNNNHPDTQVPPDLIDIRTATLSKAIGGMGGLIAGKSKFESAVQTQIANLRQNGGETLGTSTMVQTMWVLGQPTLIGRRLRRLIDMSHFCRNELARYGIHVWGNEGTPMMPVYTGRPSYAARLSYIMRGYGLLASPVVAPAVAQWEGRVRINLSAEHTDEDVDKLINAVIRGSRDLNLCNSKDVERRPYKYAGPEADHDQEDAEASVAYDRIRDLTLQSAESLKPDASIPWNRFRSRCGPSIIDAGQAAQGQFGLGSGGSRWISGAFPPHLKVESLVSKITGMGACLTYPDSYVGLASTISALCRLVDGFRHHCLLLPGHPPRPVSDGLALAPPKDRPHVEYFSNLSSLHALITQLSRRRNKTYFTIYIPVPTPDALIKVRDVLKNLVRDKPRRSGVTVLIHSPRCIPQDPEFAKISRHPNVEVLIFGSFHETMGLAGAYVVGSTGLILELRFTSRGYMFTTSPQPFVMDMIRATLEKWSANADVDGKKKLWLDGTP